MYTRRHLLILICLLLVLGMVRTGFVVWHEPLLGYGNNNDFLRTQGCFGIWPEGVETTPVGQHVQMPAEHYHFDHAYDRDFCYWGSGLWLFQAALWLDAAENALTGDTQFDLYMVGTLHALLFLLAAAVLSRIWWWAGQPKMAVGNAALYAFLLSDPFNTLYFNTLYLEGVALLYAYVAVSLTFLALFTTPGRWLWAVLALSWLAFGTVKAQYMLHPLVGVGLFLFMAWRRNIRIPRVALAMLAGTVIASLAFQSYSMQRTEFMRWFKPTNLTNLYLDVILGHAEDPHALAEALELPRECGDHAGKNRFHPDMIGGHVCPEVEQLSRADLLTVVLHDPLLLPRTIPGAARRTQDWLCTRFGVIHGEDMGRLDFAGIPYFSLGHVAAILPMDGLAFWMVMAAVATMGAAARLIFPHFGPFVRESELSASRYGEGGPALSLLAVTLIGMLGHLTFAISLLGDGYSDIARHNHLYQNMLGLLLILVVARLARFIWLYFFPLMNAPK